MINETLIPILSKKLGQKLNAEQAKSVELILDECRRQMVTDLRDIAYVLATVWHECRFRSIREIKAKPGTEIWEYQKRYWPSGYYGRGFCQLTWDYNYKKFGKLLNLPLLEQPDLVLDPAIGAKILVLGMRDGLFSNHSLGKYFTYVSTDWVGARKIVNGTFKADIVAGHARDIFEILYIPSIQQQL
jgi:putative chitinase